MSVQRHLHFGETPNFPNLYKDIVKATDNKGRLAYANYDPSLGLPPTPEQIELLQNYKTTLPTLTFVGSEKLHGENMAVCYSQGEIWVQGRNYIRTPEDDQNGMAQFVEDTKQAWFKLFHHLKDEHSVDTGTHTIVIDCEWAGGNIQSGNAACSGTPKGAYIFDYCRIVDNISDETTPKHTAGITAPTELSIYLMSAFDTYSIVLDFNNSSSCIEDLKSLAEAIEAKSPIATYHNKPDNVGEGAYLWSTYNGTLYRLKTKGEKHGGKAKEPRDKKSALTDEESKRLYEIADKVTPVWRITQAITETGATEMKHLGLVIKWVMNDITKEEQPVLLEESLDLKAISRYVSSIVKTYFENQLSGL